MTYLKQWRAFVSVNKEDDYAKDKDDCEHKDIEIVDEYYGHPDHTSPIRHTYCVECGIDINEIDQDDQ